MRKLALAAIFMGASALAACGGGDDDGGDDDVDLPDDVDASTITACNPVNQTGCEAGQKCTFVNYQEEPALGKTECVADGSVDFGGACEAGMPGATTGFDNCKAGLYCVNDVCTDICTQTDKATCQEGYACVIYADTFDDLGEDSTIGLCAPTCNPVTQDCEVETQACYLLVTDGAGTCAGVPPDAAELTQGEVCYGPMAGSCYLNGCAKGYQAILLAEAGSDDAVCGAFCTPVDTYATGDANDVDGADPANCGVARVGVANQGCGFIQSIFAGSDTFNPELIDVGYGICYNGATWGTCADYDPEAMVAAFNEAYDENLAMTDMPMMASAAGNEALCTFCETDANCANAMNPQCVSGVGCLSIANQDMIDMGYRDYMAAKATARKIQTTSRKRITGVILPDGQVVPPAPVE